jgi:hypothetical protein
MKCVFGVALIAGLLSPWACQAKVDQDGNFEILGAGAYPCGEWTNSRAGNGLMTEHMFSWVLGFLTAYNRYGPGTSNVSKSFDVEGVEGLVDKYCSQHPLENLATATEGLAMELQKLAEP